MALSRHILVFLALVTVNGEEVASGDGVKDSHEDLMEQHEKATLDLVEIVNSLSEKVDGMQVEIDHLKQENMILKTKGARSCKELKEKGFVQSGIYQIDPDSTGIPIDVHCDMINGTTEVGHDTEQTVEIGYCSGDGCFSQEYNYTAPMSQIEALVAMSDTCEQEIKYDCNIAPLKASGLYGFYYGWWVDRHGQKKFYFDGSDEDLHVCGCYPNCQQAMFNSTCNCDASLVPFWNSDAGKITNKNSLPVKAFSYGGFISNQQKAKITVGRLRCSGLAHKSSDLTSTCSSLKKGGARVSGFYLTKPTADAEDLQVSYCRMSQHGYQEDSLRLGNSQNINQDRVMMDFHVTSYTRELLGSNGQQNQRRSGSNWQQKKTLSGIKWQQNQRTSGSVWQQNQRISGHGHYFMNSLEVTGNKTEEELDKDGMDLKSGTLTIQEPGIYAFYLDKRSSTGAASYTILDLNGSQIKTNTMLLLKTGDKIRMKSSQDNSKVDFIVYKLA